MAKKWKRLRDQTDLKRRASGKKLIKCKTCDGTGVKEEGYTDYDGSGSFWVPAISCPYCFMGFQTVPCSKEEKIEALKELLKQEEEKLQNEEVAK